MPPFAKIRPYCAPYNALCGLIFAFWRSLFSGSTKNPSALRSALKIALRERFNLSDCKNTADLGLFLNGARYGLLLAVSDTNRGSIRARMGSRGGHTLPNNARGATESEGKHPWRSNYRNETKKIRD